MFISGGLCLSGYTIHNAHTSSSVHFIDINGGIHAIAGIVPGVSLIYTWLNTLNYYTDANFDWSKYNIKILQIYKLAEYAGNLF